MANRLGYGIKEGLAQVFEISEAASQLLVDVTQAFALRLVEGMGDPGLVLAAIGLLIFAGSFFVRYLRPDRTVH